MGENNCPTGSLCEKGSSTEQRGRRRADAAPFWLLRWVYNPPSPTLKVKATSEPVTSTDAVVNGFPEGQIWQMSFHWI